VLGARNLNIGSKANNIEPEYLHIQVTITEGGVIDIASYIRGDFDSAFNSSPRIAMIKLVKES
jgi:hypothetical protein